MKIWEVIIPRAEGGALQTLTIRAATWMMALNEGLQSLGDPASLSGLTCNITPHGSLEVVDTQGRRTFTIREVSESAESLQGAPPPAPSRGAGHDLPAAPDPPGAPSSRGAKGHVTAQWIPTAAAPKAPAGGGAPAALDPVQPAAASPAPEEPKYVKRRTAERVAIASDFFARDPVQPRAPSPAAPAAKAPEPQESRDRLSASGELALDDGDVKPVPATAPSSAADAPQPGIILSDDLAVEIAHLEEVRRAREAALAPPAMRPIPHKVFKVVASAPDASRSETVRKRYVSVWPNPPEDALREVLEIHLTQIQSELQGVSGAIRVQVAAFDHAFESVALRPPIGLCQWSVGPDGRAAEPTFALGAAATALWDPNQSSTGSVRSPLLVPAVLPGGADGPTASANGHRATAVVSVPGRTPPASAESVATGGATPGPASASAPAGAAGTAQPAAPATPAPAAPAEAPGTTAASPAGTPGDEPGPMAAAFERMHALFYMTDRAQAFAYVLDSALDLLHAEAGAILLYDPQQGNLYLAASRGPQGATAPGYRVPLGDGVAGFCAVQGLPLALTHTQPDTRFRSALSEALGIGVHSLAGAPIQYEGQVYGVIELVNQRRHRAFSPAELNALAYLARQLADRLQSGRI